MELVFWTLVFIASLSILLKSSEAFTESSEKIGLYLGLPAFIVGVTIVSIGTSTPEIISSFFAVLKQSSEIVVGNAVGSNIANICLVIGIAAIVGKKLCVTYEIIHVDLPFFMGSALLLTATCWDGLYTLGDAVLSLAVLLIYLHYTFNVQRNLNTSDEEINARVLHKKTLINFFISMLFIYLGAKYTIESVIKLSEILDIGKEIIALGAVALGTSLPELIVTLTASRKGNNELAIGNVLGSNIVNACAVMGIPTLISPLIVTPSLLSFGIPMMLIATFMYFFIAQDKEITKWEGWLLLIFYAFFVGKLITGI